MMKISLENIIKKTKNRLKKIFNSHLTANQIAINCAVGILVGLLIPMGLQTVGVIALCAIFRLNFVIVVFATLITNPFTFIFIYYSAFKVGDFFINSGISWASIESMLNNPEVESVLSLSYSSIKVIYTGLMLEAVIFTPLIYIFIYQIASHFKSKNNFNISELSND